MENLDDELMDLFDRSRMGILKAPEKERLDRRLTDPKTRAIWDDLHRIARAYATKEPRTLPEDFSARVKAEISRREASGGAPEIPSAGRTTRSRPRVREAVGLALAAGVGGLVMGRWLVPAPGWTGLGGFSIPYACQEIGATVDGEPRSLEEIHSTQPTEIRAEGQTVPAQIRILAPEATVCLAKGPNGCTEWTPAPTAVLIYQCRKL